jgi:uncharacterized protein (TIGR00369 family)
MARRAEPVRAECYAPLPADVAERWGQYPDWGGNWFPTIVGLRLEEVRVDYCRMRLPYRSELDQPAGVVHGGAVATLIDSVVVPAVGTAYDAGWSFVTVGMNINYVGSVVRQDAIAEGWVTKRGSSLVFCEAAVTTADGRTCATSSLIYSVRGPRPS